MSSANADDLTINIGPAIRSRRRELNLTLEDVAARVGVTKGFLSEIERDKSSPSVATLVQICNTLGLPLGSLFAPVDSAVVRKGKRTRINFGGRDLQDYLVSPSKSRRFQAILSFMKPGGGGGETPYRLESDEEFLYVLGGSVVVDLDGQEIRLDEGDTLTFSPRLLHTFRNASDTEPANVLFIVSPPPA